MIKTSIVGSQELGLQHPMHKKKLLLAVKALEEEAHTPWVALISSGFVVGWLT